LDERGVFIATSGWQYGHWTGPFYPEDLPKTRLFDYYSSRFNTVEVNNSFYRLPEAKTFERWREKSPGGFIFALKASRFITHVKRLKEPEGPIKNFMERAVLLEEKLGPILFQLPPRWNINTERLRFFLEALPEGYRYAFECRDPSWFHPDVYALLKAHNAAFCIFDFDYMLSPRQVTADFVYIRLHGPAGKYRGQYSDGALRDWAGFIRNAKRRAKAVYCYFDNDEAGYAALDAMRLREMLGKK